MKRNTAIWGSVAVSILMALAAGTAIALEENRKQPEPDVFEKPVTLVDSAADILGHPIYYPGGAPAKLVGQIITLEPGAHTPWHSHGVPTFGYLLQGEISVHYATGDVRMFKAGDSLIEAQHTPHMGVVSGSAAAKILVVYAGAEGQANTTLESPPR